MALEVESITVESGTNFYQSIQNNGSETVINTIDQYEIITGNRVEHLINNFIVENSGLKYIGNNTVKILLNASVTWEAAGTLNALYKIGIFKNGLNLGKMEGSLDNSNAWPRNVGFNSLIELSTNDFIDIRVTNENNTQGVIIIDLLFTGYSI